MSLVSLLHLSTAREVSNDVAPPWRLSTSVKKHSGLQTRRQQGKTDADTALSTRESAVDMHEEREARCAPKSGAATKP